MIKIMLMILFAATTVMAQSQSFKEKLIDLYELKEKGILTEEEYKEQKAQILTSSPSVLQTDSTPSTIQDQKQRALMDFLMSNSFRVQIKYIEPSSTHSYRLVGSFGKPPRTTPFSTDNLKLAESILDIKGIYFDSEGTAWEAWYHIPLNSMKSVEISSVGSLWTKAPRVVTISLGNKKAYEFMFISSQDVENTQRFKALIEDLIN